jgi:arsenate reductase
MAEGFTRALGAGKVSAFSAGSRPSGKIHPVAVRLMLERGIDLAGQASKPLDALPQGIEWEAIVTMGCGDACPHLPARRRIDWDLPDPKNLDDDAFRRVRDAIASSVGSLIETICSGPGNLDTERDR